MTKIRAMHLVKTAVGATWALRQTRELMQLGVEVHVVLPEAGPMKPRYEEHGITVHLADVGLPTREPWRALERFREIRALVAKVEPDVLHSHFLTTTVAMRLALGKRHTVPRVFQVPGPLHLEHAPFRVGELASAGPSDSWIASCQWTYDRYVRSGISRDRLFLSHYGSDVDDFVVTERGALRQELGLATTTKIVGMVAYMYAPKRYLGQQRGLKGHEDLIDAIRLCLDRGLDVVGVFVGGAWDGAVGYERQVRDYARQRCGDKVIFTGTRTDVLRLYSDFDVAVHPSHSENLGAAAESMLMGVPTVATNVGGFPDLVTPGSTGWLVPPKDPAAIATALESVFADPKRAATLAEAGRRHARGILDIRENAKQVLAAYQAVLHRHHDAHRR